LIRKQNGRGYRIEAMYQRGKKNVRGKNQKKRGAKIEGDTCLCGGGGGGIKNLFWGKKKGPDLYSHEKYNAKKPEQRRMVLLRGSRGAIFAKGTEIPGMLSSQRAKKGGDS